jgi:biopolymer transport protein ExbB/TolQ
MTGNQSFLEIVLGASFVVQLVMLLLLVASVASWAIILKKRRVLRKAVEGSDAFETTFWSGGDLTSIYRDVTKGGTSPTDMAGLFGTVWGIMNSFHAIGNVQSATLAMVAPGISEALIATAMGLFAAIPAVIAYNRYADKVTRLEVRYDTFAEEFAAILQRHTPARREEREAR